MSEWKETEIGLIPEEWNIYTLSKYIKQKRGICYGVVQPGFHDENGLPIIRVNNIKNGRIITDEVLKISPDIESKYKRSRLEGDEILITLVGNVGEVAIVDSRYKNWNVARAVGVLPIDKNIDKNWLKYWLQSSQVQQYINSHCNTTVQITFNLGDVCNLPILDPPLVEQKRIADVLSCLDAKIENLRRQNETLEAIAQTLFKHWFIDFEFPNADGKPYKSSGGAMIPSELGDIPEGWRVGKLEELITVNPRESIKNGEIVKYVDMKALSTSSMEITGYVTREFTSGSKFRNQDTLLARITPCLENGKTAFVSILDNEEVAFGSTEFIVLRAKQNCCPEYVYPLARSAYFRDFAVKNMTGSSGRQRIPNDVIANYKLSIPDIKTIKSYQNLCRPLFLKTSSNQKQIQTLTKTRDALLPKLISGQLRIKE
ncbi:restriction endonuclease subunit S [Nostoc sp. LEGE 12447]|uniref:restriction endonuclease subunit S n=1 Tax=Nostoc sp. LEGE 12447 TaxID=1828640 RepID=UPI001883A91F|nr:restriction endonuclease subunit S [Nostoc sp. LEGE 12447]MBE9002015.1 restriction endonuclease subunit S [Nostoc sp. LEGE 12447]